MISVEAVYRCNQPCFILASFLLKVYAKREFDELR